MKQGFMIFFIVFLALMVSCRNKTINEVEVTPRSDEILAYTTIEKNQFEEEDLFYDTVFSENVNYIDNSIEIRSTDTLLKGEYLVLFEPTGHTVINDYFPDQDIRDSMIKDYGNYYEAIGAIESYLNKIHSDIFVITDNDLVLFLENRKQLKLPKISDDFEMSYCFHDYLSQVDYVLLHVQTNMGYSGWNSYMLVNRKNGHQKLIKGLPYFSPDKKQVITANYDAGGGFNFNGIEYYRIDADTLVKIFECDIKNWGPSNLKWTSDTSVKIEQIRFAEMGFDYDEPFHKEYSTMKISKK